MISTPNKNYDQANGIFHDESYDDDNINNINGLRSRRLFSEVGANFAI